MNQMVSFGERLREERTRLGLTQPGLGEIGGVTKKTQMLYEGGERSPDANYLMAIAEEGADITYVLTGQRGVALAPVLSPEEKLMLEYFRDASREVRRAALGALLGAAQAGQIGGTHSQHSSGDGSIQIGSIGNVPAKRRR